MKVVRMPTGSNFNPRSHEGSDINQRRHLFKRAISIRAPTRGATRGGMSCWRMHSDFNPRSHEGSDYCLYSSVYPFRISIRAPTRGATMYATPTTGADRISIRAPTRGATILLYTVACVLIFQSALPRGERPFVSTGTNP